MSRSSSISVRYLMALGRSLGRTCRFEAVSVAAAVAETRLDGGGRSISDHIGREKVGHCWPSAVIPYAAIMPPSTSASNFEAGLPALRSCV